MTHDIKTVAVIGTGVIGSGWSARLLAHGYEVIAWDPGQDWQSRLRAALENAWPAVCKLGLFPGASLDRLRCAESMEAACTVADFIQESAPEQLELKRNLIAAIDTCAGAGTIIASSTSGLLPSDFQVDCARPERVIVGHPFNPVYLLPLVEVLGGRKTAPEAVERAIAFYTDLGMRPLRVRNEIEGFISDRLQEALWREILHLVNDDIASTGELDAAITYGPGLRWAFMGTCLAFHMAGGDGGMRDFMKQFGPALKLPWTKLESPELTDELIDKMTAGTEQQAAGLTVKELERLRDDCLIAIMQALQQYKVGAGQILAQDEQRRELRN